MATKGSALDDDFQLGVIVGSLTASLAGLTLLRPSAGCGRVVADQSRAGG
ncbi:hypothetical protein [Nocardioides dongkuii]|nr:hypothetical protein [Nocardioides dongkuii]